MTFDLLGLSDELLRSVAEAGYNEPTAIQRQAVPAILMSRDIIGVAQTGTGKTAAFVLPIIDILGQGRARARMARCLILAPTRELAQQVSENFVKYGKNHKLTMVLLIGGVAFGDQDSALQRGVDVLIATPGRFIDQFERGKILLSGVEMLVIDEADRMLDMGFIPDVERICALLPAKRQTLLFSATMPGPVKKLADRFMKTPKLIEVARPASTNADITQSVVETTSRGKRDTLRVLLKGEGFRNAIVFCNRKRDVRELYDYLKRDRFRVGQIHGDMEQADRIRELDRFKADEVSILVASDVAARGLDIKGVSHIFNFDVPYNADDYVHRIGRTGRAGAKGTAITLATADEAEKLVDIEKLIGQKIPRAAGAPLPDEAEPEREAERESPRRREARDRDAPRRRATRKEPEDEREPALRREARAEQRVDAEREGRVDSRKARAEAPRERVRREEPQPRPRRDEPRPERRRSEAPVVDGRWEGPVPGFLQLSARA